MSQVPRGPKSNVSYLVDNTMNVERQASSKQRTFWDDCGVWKSGGPVCRRTFLVRDGHLTVVKMLNGQCCVRKMVDKVRRWVPLQVAGTTGQVVVMRQMYTHHKVDRHFRKRVSWLEQGPGPAVALYEYVGEMPTSLPPHGNAKQTQAEYVRTKPDVMEGIRTELVQGRCKPRDVYARMTADNESFSRPRDNKQVRNVARSVKTANAEQFRTTGNAADEMQKLVGSVHDHPFVKEVCVRHGKPPIIIAYTEAQLIDLKRCSSASTPLQLRSVVGVDRTFNLGPCYVTITVFKNMALLRKETRDNPIFLGPTMFHFDAKQETYSKFFHQSVMRCLAS